MKLGIYSVYDKAVKAYLQPFYARSRGEALRSFMEAVAKPDHQFSKHAADFLMVYLGEFDDGNGLFAPVEPERVISALECMPDGVTAFNQGDAG